VLLLFPICVMFRDSCHRFRENANFSLLVSHSHMNTYICSLTFLIPPAIAALSILIERDWMVWSDVKENWQKNGWVESGRER